MGPRYSLPWRLTRLEALGKAGRLLFSQSALILFYVEERKSVLQVLLSLYYPVVLVSLPLHLPANSLTCHNPGLLVDPGYNDQRVRCTFSE
jgi:hypothetical protein